jgi:hypothetical protein
LKVQEISNQVTTVRELKAMKKKVNITIVDDNDPRIAMQRARLAANPEVWDNDEYLAMLDERFDGPEYAVTASPLERELYVRFASLMNSYRKLEAEYMEDVA